MIETRIKKVVSLVVLLTVALLGTGTTYAASPKNDSRLFEASRFVIVLQDSFGDLWGLDIYFGCVLYGVFYSPAEPLLWPAYGFIFGNEMVLWADGTGTGGYVDSFAYVGAWDFAKMTYTGNWVNFVFPTTSNAGSVEMWLYGTKSVKATKTGLNPSVAAPNMQGRGINPGVATSGERAKTLQDIPLTFAFADLTDRGAYKFKDSYGFLWDLDLLLGIIYYGTITYSATEKWPAFGFRNDGEMFLWANAPEGTGYMEFVYIGKYNSADKKYYGAWANYGTGNGLVTWWSGLEVTDYYAVITGEGYTCAWADNDAYDVYNVLTSYAMWKPANIILLVSNAAGTIHDCTRTNIQNAIAWMASMADANDVCVFFYAGHGGYTTDVAPIDETDGKDEYIAPEGGIIRDDELDVWLSACSGFKLVALDSCYSGGFFKATDMGGMVSRSVPELPRVEIIDDFARDLNKVGWNVHSACDANELAYGSGGLQNGVFTYYFVEGLYGPADSNVDGDVDALEAHYYTRPKVITYTGDVQHPWLWYGTSPNPLIWVK